MTRILSFALLILVFAGASCNKNKDSKSKTEMLTQSRWRFSSYTTKDNLTGTVYDNFTSAAACSKDNEFTFATNGVHEYTEGATKCNPGDPQVIYFASWEFTNNEASLRIYSGSMEVIYRIVELSDNVLSLEEVRGTAVDNIRFIH